MCTLVPVLVDSEPFSVCEAGWCNTDGDFVDGHVSGANTGLDVGSRSSRPAEETQQTLYIRPVIIQWLFRSFREINKAHTVHSNYTAACNKIHCIIMRDLCVLKKFSE